MTIGILLDGSPARANHAAGHEAERLPWQKGNACVIWDSQLVFNVKGAMFLHNSRTTDEQTLPAISTHMDKRNIATGVYREILFENKISIDASLVGEERWIKDSKLY